MKYNWIISSLDSKLVEGSLTDVVINIHWRRSLETDDYNPETKTGYYADVYGSLTLPGPADPDNFIPYADLTELDVENWLNEMKDPTPVELDQQLAANIELQKNPVEESLPLPWAE
jgi:hypothetical protein